METNDTQRLMTIPEAAKRLQVAEKSLYNWLCPGSKNKIGLKVKRIGRCVRISEKDLNDFIESCSNE